MGFNRRVAAEGFRERQAVRDAKKAEFKEKYGDDCHDGYVFMGWTPMVNPVVSEDDADNNGKNIYTATWQKLKDLSVLSNDEANYVHPALRRDGRGPLRPRPRR